MESRRATRWSWLAGRGNILLAEREPPQNSTTSSIHFDFGLLTHVKKANWFSRWLVEAAQCHVFVAVDETASRCRPASRLETYLQHGLGHWNTQLNFPRLRHCFRSVYRS